MKRWTQEQVAKIPAGKHKKPHNLGNGLHVMVYPSGARSFGTIFRNENGNPQFRRFAPCKIDGPTEAGAMTIDQARIYILEHALARATDRRDVVDTTTHKRVTLTFNDLRDEFLEGKINIREDISSDRKKRYAHTLTAHFCNRSIPDHSESRTWGELKLAQFCGGDWPDRYAKTLHLVEKRAALGGDRRGPCTLAHETDQFAQQMFAYAVKKGYIRPEHVPERMQHVNKPQAIERSLSVTEIEHLFNVTSTTAVYGNDSINEYDAVFTRLLLMTGIRLNSVRLARRSHLHLQLRNFWTFPADDLKKTKRQRAAPADHHIPCTSLMAIEIARLDLLSGEYDYLFPERYAGRRPPDQVQPRNKSWAGHLLEEHAKLLNNLGERAYSAHAFRRTMSNTMLELGIEEKVIEKCAARVPRGTAKTYLTAEIRDQVMNAFEQYHDFLHACMLGKGEAYLADVREARTAHMRREIAARRKRIGLKTLAVP